MTVELCAGCGEAACLACDPLALSECAGRPNRLECDECMGGCHACLDAMREEAAGEIGLAVLQEGDDR